MSSWSCHRSGHREWDHGRHTSGYALSHVIESDYDSDYQEYFQMFVDSVDLSSLMIGSKHMSFITFSYSLPKMEAHDMTQLKWVLSEMILNHSFFFQDTGGSLYLGGGRFAKSITSKLIRDFFRHWFNTMELWRDLPKQSCWYFTFLFKLNVKVTV